jgi:hypothetical protein
MSETIYWVVEGILLSIGFAVGVLLVLWLLPPTQAEENNATLHEAKPRKRARRPRAKG